MANGINLGIFSKFHDQGVKDAQTGLDRLAGFADKAGIAIAAGLAIGAAAAVNLGIQSAKAASNFEETGAAVKQIFGDASSELESFAKTASTSLGQSQTQFLQGAKTFGIFGQAAGLSAKENVEFAKTLGVLATDLASFNNTSVDEAITSIGAALRGESEPIRRFGVLLDDATLKARALSMGIYDGTGSLTQQQRVMAAYQEILAQTTTQQGDFERTSGGMANGLKTIQAEFENLKIVIGESITPAVEGAIPKIREFIEGFVTDPDFQKYLADLSQILVDMLPKLEPVLNNFGDLLIILLPGLNPLLEAMGGALEGISIAMQNVSEDNATLFKDFENLAYIIANINSGLRDWNDFLDTIESGMGDLGPIATSILEDIFYTLNPVASGLQKIADLIKWINGTTVKTSGISYNNDGSLNRDGNPVTPFAKGGIVTAPTLGLVGEAGPEAIIPLDRFQQVVGGSGANVTININAGLGTDGAALGEQVVNAIRRYERSSGAVFAKA